MMAKIDIDIAFVLEKKSLIITKAMNDVMNMITLPVI